MQRRTFVFGGIAALTAAPSLVKAKIYTPPSPRLCLYHTHTREYMELDYKPSSTLVDSSLEELNYFMRDHRTDQTWFMDPQLFDILYDLQYYSRNRNGVFEIISAYRSPQTNAMLRRRSRRVAKHSLHQEGRALDIRLRGTSTSSLRTLAIEMQKGGVGYYPRSNFVHVDTGNVRRW